MVEFMPAHITNIHEKILLILNIYLWTIRLCFIAIVSAEIGFGIKNYISIFNVPIITLKNHFFIWVFRAPFKSIFWFWDIKIHRFSIHHCMIWSRGEIPNLLERCIKGIIFLLLIDFILDFFSALSIKNCKVSLMLPKCHSNIKLTTNLKNHCLYTSIS